MANVRNPLPVKLFIGLLSPDPPLFSECISLFGPEYGPVELESGVLPWNMSGYYQDEMGSPLYRKFVFFEQVLEPDRLPAVKLFAVSIEKQFSQIVSGMSKRRINIDPGYVTEAKVVLSTTKDFSHRIYIGSGIYGEVTLRFGSKQQSFVALDHTYYDYRTAEYISLFNRARLLLRRDLGR